MDARRIIAGLKRIIRKGDRLKYVPNVRCEANKRGSYIYVNIEGVVHGVYPNILVLDTGKWKESVTFAELVCSESALYLNGKRVEM